MTIHYQDQSLHYNIIKQWSANLYRDNSYNTPRSTWWYGKDCLYSTFSTQNKHSDEHHNCWFFCINGQYSDDHKSLLIHSCPNQLQYFSYRLDQYKNTIKEKISQALSQNPSDFQIYIWWWRYPNLGINEKELEKWQSYIKNKRKEYEFFFMEHLKLCSQFSLDYTIIWLPSGKDQYTNIAVDTQGQTMSHIRKCSNSHKLIESEEPFFEYSLFHNFDHQEQREEYENILHTYRKEDALQYT